jgi:predicted ATPase
MRCSYYKSFPEATVIPLRRITILLGKNNSGKTAIARLPLAFLNAASRRNRAGDPIPLSARGVRLASAVQEIVTKQTPHASFQLGISLKGYSNPISINLEVQLRQTLAFGTTSFVSKFESPTLTRVIEWTREARPGSSIKYNDREVDSFDGIYPVYGNSRLQAPIDELRQALEQEFAGLLHLSSIRAPLATVYENRRSDLLEDARGEEVPFLLNQDPDLLSAVSAWYEANLGGVAVDVEREASAFRLILDEPAARHNLTQSGQGFQQVLPVITYLCGQRQAAFRHKLLVVEEPELHLHPAVHGALADLMVDAVVDAEQTQVIAETHSENLLLRLRRHVADGKLNPDNMGLLWFEHTEAGTRIRPIDVAPDGSVSDWPKGVFSEDLGEIRAIAQANRA